MRNGRARRAQVMLTTREAADRARVTPETILAWRHTWGLVPTGYNGRTFLWNEKDIEAQLAWPTDSSRVNAILKRRIA